MELIKKLTIEINNWRKTNPGKPDPYWLTEKIQIIETLENLFQKKNSLKLFDTWETIEKTINSMCERDPELTIISIEIPLVSYEKINFRKKGLISFTDLLNN